MTVHYEPCRLYAVSSWRGKDLWAFRARRGEANRWVDMWCVQQDDDGDTRGLEDSEVTDVRPLVVLDPDQCPYGLTGTFWWLRRLADEDAARAGSETPRLSVLRWVVGQIEAQISPPKPAEPGKYGVVLAGDGREWLRYTDREINGFDWVRPHTNVVDGTAYARWRDLDVVRVIREGVTPC